MAKLFAIVIFLALIFSAIGGFIFMLAWNFVAVGLFGLPELSFVQAWVLLFLIGMIRQIIFVEK